MKCAKLIICESFEEASEIASMYAFASNCYNWSFVRAGEPPFSRKKYEKYSRKGDFCFGINADQKICDYGTLDALSHMCDRNHYLRACDLIDAQFSEMSLEEVLGE